jgi:endonuclease YncB( thermonuclease family)
MNRPLPQRLARQFGAGALALAAAWAGAAAPASTAAAKRPVPFDATVTRVVDGDSLWLLPVGGDTPVEVRVQDIDAPEICQSGGREARAALAELVAQKTLYVQPRGRDTHGRMLALLMVQGVDVGAWMVVEGHAWSIRTKWDRGPLVKQERVAQSLRRGLWGVPGAVPPKDFRRSHGPCAPG